MEWRRAQVQWDQENFPGASAATGGAVLDSVEVAFEGSWIHVRQEGITRSYPSHLVFRVIWYDRGGDDVPVIDDVRVG